MKKVLGLVMVLFFVSACTKEDAVNEIESEANPDLENPESKGILYTSDKGDHFEIYHKFNGEESKIETLKGDNWWPRAHPDGERFLFYNATVQLQSREINDYSSAKLCIGHLDSGGVETIISANDHGWSQHGFANWSADGEYIILSAMDNSIGKWQIYRVDADGENPLRISRNDQKNYYDPVLSNDGNHIACVTNADSTEETINSAEIFMIDVETGEETQLTDNEFSDHNPDFSSDDSRIIFTSLIDQSYLGIGKWALREVNVSNKSVYTVLEDENINLFPRFAIDDQSVYFNRIDLNTFKLTLARWMIEDNSVSQITNEDNNALNVDPF